MSYEGFQKRHDELWHAATHHPFLDGVRDGSLPVRAFDLWLVQDYHFVATAFAFQSLVLSIAPRGDQRLLVDGLSALVAELDWFETHAAARGLLFDAPLQPACRAYGDFLLATAREPYAATITTVWTVERAYLEAWNSARPGAPAYQEYVEHWTAPGFEAYVSALAAAADRALMAATPEARRAAEGAFIWTARYEREFWQMALQSDVGEI